MARRIPVKAKATKSDTAVDAVEQASPNPMTNLILTDLLLRGGGRIMRHAIEAALLSTKYDKAKARKIVKGRTIGQTLITTAAARIATRSVPGAIIVGGASIAKLLYDRRRGKLKSRIEGQQEVAEQAAKGAQK